MNHKLVDFQRLEKISPIKLHNSSDLQRFYCCEYVSQYFRQFMDLFRLGRYGFQISPEEEEEVGCYTIESKETLPLQVFDLLNVFYKKCIPLYNLSLTLS